MPSARRVVVCLGVHDMDTHGLTRAVGALLERRADLWLTSTEGDARLLRDILVAVDERKWEPPVAQSGAAAYGLKAMLEQASAVVYPDSIDARDRRAIRRWSWRTGNPLTEVATTAP